MSICKLCGKEVTWIKTKSGKNMPVEPRIVPYWDGVYNRNRVVTEYGEVVACELRGNVSDVRGFGYIPHWTSCKKTAHEELKAGNKEGDLFGPDRLD